MRQLQFLPLAELFSIAWPSLVILLDYLKMHANENTNKNIS